MLQRIVRHLRANLVAYLALAVALGGGGGYAVAAMSRSKTITVCANKKSGLLYLHRRGRCKRGQTRVSWNQRGPAGPRGAAGAQGPQGLQGQTGLTGPSGAPADAFGVVASDGTLAFGAQGLSSQRLSAGTYQITITAPACAQGANVPTVTVSDGPPGSQSSGSFPMAWIENTGDNRSFTVFTGFVASGSFSATDQTFNVQDVC